MRRELARCFPCIYAESSSLWVCVGAAARGVEEDGS